MEGTNYLEIANSLAMWSAAGLAVAVVLVQALIFSKKSYSTGLEMGLPRADEGAIKSLVAASRWSVDCPWATRGLFCRGVRAAAS